MFKTHRIALIAAVLAGALTIPATAAAADAHVRRAALQTKRIGATQSARSYSSWAHGQINDAVRRIDARAATLRLSPSQRELLHNNTVYSANLLRARVAKVSADGRVTSAERHEVRNYTSALQAELRKAHGNIDSFWLL